MRNSWMHFAAAVLLAGCAALPSAPAVQTVPPVAVVAPPPPPVALDPAPTQSYLLNLGDEVEIHVAEKPELNQTTKIRPDGWITLPYIGSVRAAGRAPEDLQSEITRRYRELGAGSLAATGRAAATYPIAIGDLLEVKFANHPELNQAQRVRPDGRISLSLVKSVVAEGKSPEALEAELLEMYSRFLKRIELVVIVGESTSNRILVGGVPVRAGFSDVRPIVSVKAHAPEQIFVGGEVARPGMLAWRANSTALTALLEAGGSKPTGEMRSVLILRKIGAEDPKVLRIDLGSDLTANTTHDVYLRPNDMVIVPRTAIADLALFLDQYLFQIIPPLRNSSFGFVYDLRGSTTTHIQTN